MQLKELRRLKKHYDGLGIKECWCGHNSSMECPKHINSWIESMEAYPRAYNMPDDTQPSTDRRSSPIRQRRK